MKSFIRTFLLTAILGSIVWGFYFTVIRDSPFWWGIVAGFVFGLTVATITRIRQNRVADSPPVLTDETILREGPATHEDLVGRLYLTNRRILFEGYPTDESAPEIARLFEGRDQDGPAYEASIPILRIAGVKHRGLGIGSQLEIAVTDGEVKAFGTEDLAAWIDDIATARQKFLDEPRSENMKLFP